MIDNYIYLIDFCFLGVLICILLLQHQINHKRKPESFEHG